MTSLNSQHMRKISIAIVVLVLAIVCDLGTSVEDRDWDFQGDAVVVEVPSSSSFVSQNNTDVGPVSLAAFRESLNGPEGGFGIVVQKKQKKGNKTQKKRPPTVRSKKPDFSKTNSDTRKIYFDDVLKEGITGPLPDLKTNASAIASNKKDPSGTNSGSGGDTAKPSNKTSPFSGLITASTVESQVKRTVNDLGKIITTPRKFRTDYNKAHIAFTKLAVLFGVNEVMTEEVRWHSQAAKLRLSLAKTAASCRVGTPQAYQAAKQSLEDMKTVLNGSKPALPEAKEALTEWDMVADRGPLMSWLEDLYQNQIRRNINSVSALKNKKDEVKESAELVAAIAKILTLPEMDDYDDEDYTPHANSMLESAKKVAQGIAASDFESAISSANGIEKSCTACHADYN